MAEHFLLPRYALWIFRLHSVYSYDKKRGVILYDTSSRTCGFRSYSYNKNCKQIDAEVQAAWLQLFYREHFLKNCEIQNYKVCLWS